MRVLADTAVDQSDARNAKTIITLGVSDRSALANSA